ncbi:hypothetical protein J3P95_10905 [Pseudomonas sp. Z5-35]|uniref:hypothetical protein n=1 Tax=unclassified Pseudomonas TaxID=196821 RepID=UPI003DA9C4C5
MQNELRKARQLDAASRLRAMQREKAELAYNHRCRELARAENVLSEERARYESLRTNFEALRRVGVALDPSLHEQRLLAQHCAYQRLEAAYQPVAEALRLVESTKKQLLKCRTNEDLIRKAKEQVQRQLDKYSREVEAIDIFDAQAAQGVGYGY